MKNTYFFVFISLILLAIIQGCCSENTLVDISQPGGITVCSSVDHFKITVKGKIDSSTFKTYELPPELDLSEYDVLIAVEPKNSEGVFPNKPKPARAQWEVDAFLGGVGEFSAKDGERFDIVAILTRSSLGEKYGRFEALSKLSDTYQISTIKTISVER